MFAVLLSFLTLVAIPVIGEPAIKTTVSDGVSSLGYKVVYGDQDMSILNEVVRDDEKLSAKNFNLNEEINPLPPQDVKCLMSVDRYCSKEMGQLKSVLIQAVKEDCEKCSADDKERAGKMIAALMAHDPVAWKLFLTRCALQSKKREESRHLKSLNLRMVGKGEEVVRSPNDYYVMPGVKVRVRRYASELVP